MKGKNNLEHRTGVNHVNYVLNLDKLEARKPIKIRRHLDKFYCTLAKIHFINS